MRKDKGLNGDLDRLPMLTWIMFLKFLDDMEQIRQRGSHNCRPALPPGHRIAVSLARLGRERGRYHRR
jgi:type I restriction enzyme M protein